MTWKNLKNRLGHAGYVSSDELSMAIYIALQLERPILLEGDAGVGKTQVAKTIAEIEDTELIRLQCYEGLDAAAAIYEWNYQRQLLSIRASADSGVSPDKIENRIFSREFLLERPLLRAIQQERPPVLLIDEIDRADEEFEAFLLEILSDFQITIPELGTIAATSKPIVVLTANGTRDLSDALRRRCIYSHVPFPDRAT
ncbi:MAG TPA: ATPase, partial [Planctomycetaceae bacterium]|nr:ATPase [Planctomycetaceae bacterium]